VTRASFLLAVALAATGLLAGNAHGAFGGSGRWITYPDGRVFVPHGLNLVVTRPPYWNSWFGAEDARFLASQGFSAMRITFLPQALEPELGQVDARYAGHFVEREALLARFGMATLLTLNQDGYAESCGGDGFPEWAVIDSCEAPWQPFWADEPAGDGIGLQDHYRAWWRGLATRFADARGLLGYDLLNEPKAPDEAALTALWRSTAETIRTADRSHLVFVEPRDPGAPGTGGALPASTGFAGHVYCLPTLDKELRGVAPTRREVDACIADDAGVLGRQVAFARRERLPLLVGEFGASDELREQRALVEAMATSFVPWFVYAYNGRLDSSGAPAQSLLRDEAQPGSVANARPGKLAALVVPYPMAVAGTPGSWRFDRSSRTVRFAYSTQRVDGRGRFGGVAQTVVFVPQRVYPTGYEVAVSGAKVVSGPTAPWLRLVAMAGADRVRVTIAPRTGSRTLTPLQVDRCGYDLGRCG
jgi:endoglycosylceramidase